MNNTFFLVLFFLISGCPLLLFAQNDPEFPKGFVMHVNLHNGMITRFDKSPDLYVAGIQIVPQVTVVPHLLRVGAVAGAFYADKKLQALAGPMLSLKIKTVQAEQFGSVANLHISLDHLWGTGKQKLLGGGIHADVLNKFVIGITAHRDYALSSWWFQSALAVRISNVKKIDEPFNQ